MLVKLLCRFKDDGAVEPFALVKFLLDLGLLYDDSHCVRSANRQTVSLLELESLIMVTIFGHSIVKPCSDTRCSRLEC